MFYLSFLNPTFRKIIVWELLVGGLLLLYKFFDPFH